MEGASTFGHSPEVAPNYDQDQELEHAHYAKKWYILNNNKNFKYIANHPPPTTQRNEFWVTHKDIQINW